MIRYILTSVLFLIFSMAFGQVNVSNNMTVEQYVQNVLLGNGVTATNIQYNGGPANVVRESVGRFSNPTLELGFANGFIMGTGDVRLAEGPFPPQPNDMYPDGVALGGTGAPGSDPDLDGITANDVFDEAIVEFDFVPKGDTISFRYVFASEEYPYFVCGDYNDAFGFFLTGPNPNGAAYNAQNIARIPDPSNPSAFTGTPVSINTVNSGTPGPGYTTQFCTQADPNFLSYTIFYNGDYADHDYEYNGRTVVLTAVAQVICGETYHIKLAIGDAGDAGYDSGVLLEAGSFTSSGLFIESNVTETYEGCGNAYIVVTRSDTNQYQQLPLVIGGTATMGVDYSVIPNPVIFDQGAFTDTIFIQTFGNDAAGETDETIEITIDDPDACGSPEILIYNAEPLSAMTNAGDTLCPEAPLFESHMFTADVEGGAPFGITYVWSADPPYDFGFQQGQDTIIVSPSVTTTFQLVVGDACGTAYAAQPKVVFVECLLSIPNVITPDGDNVNDVFLIANIEDYPDAELVILNRWGEVVFESVGYKNNWDADGLTEGVYFYKLYPNGRKYETGMYSGFVQVFRK